MPTFTATPGALCDVVEHRRNVLISGGIAGANLLTALATFIPDHDRNVLMEDASEIHEFPATGKLYFNY